MLLVAATLTVRYEFLPFVGTLPRRLTVPTRPRSIIVIGVVLAAHIEPLFTRLTTAPKRRDAAERRNPALCSSAGRIVHTIS